jgi:hypothetical protein
MKEEPYSTGESLVLPATVDIIEMMIGGSYTKQLRGIPLADNTVERRISDVLGDLCD